MIIWKILKINIANKTHNKNKFLKLFSSMYWSSTIMQTEHIYRSSLQIKLLQNVRLDVEDEI